MSFIITTYCNEGIVMAADSRVTYNTSNQDEDGKLISNVGINFSDNVNKLFLTSNGIGISTCGDASVTNNETGIMEPISGHIERIINERIDDKSNVEDIKNIIVDYFNDFTTTPDTCFHIAGYDERYNRKIIRLYLGSEHKEVLGSEIAGASWDGETMYFSKLINETSVNNGDFTFPQLDIPFQFFNLQDCIDFSRYAVDITIKTMRFDSVVKTVGGNIDVLVIKPKESLWISKKELH